MTVTDVDLNVTMEHLGDTSAIERDWTELESVSDATFSSSWGWVGTLLATFPDLQLSRLVARNEDESIVGLALVEETRSWLGPKRIPALHLQGSGGRLRSVGLEENVFLARRGLESSVRSSFIRFMADGIRSGTWRQVRLGWVPLDYLRVSVGEGVLAVDRWRQPDHYVDLRSVREHGDYTSLLGRRTRKAMRRSQNWYERIGPLRMDAAEDIGTALRYFERLIELHQTQWTSRGWPGSFSDPSVVAFHRELIHRRLADGEVQLTRVRAGDHEVGYLYNFAHRGRVYAFQSGLSYEEHNAYQPGRMCDWLAVQHNADRGLEVYDLLLGDSQFKRTMATNTEERVYVILCADRLTDRLQERAWTTIFSALEGGRIHRAISRTLRWRRRRASTTDAKVRR